MKSQLSALGMFLGRLAIAAIFLFGGVSKFVGGEATSAYMAAKGMENVTFFLYAAAILEILGAILLIIGWKTRWIALLMLVFLGAVTYIFHDFWNVQEPLERYTQTLNFLKNLGIGGGLLYILAVGAGKWSLDRCCCSAAEGCHVHPKNPNTPNNTNTPYNPNTPR